MTSPLTSAALGSVHSVVVLMGFSCLAIPLSINEKAEPSRIGVTTRPQGALVDLMASQGSGCLRRYRMLVRTPKTNQALTAPALNPPGRIFDADLDRRVGPELKQQRFAVGTSDITLHTRRVLCPAFSTVVSEAPCDSRVGILPHC